jgi:hypothetical protein
VGLEVCDDGVLIQFSTVWTSVSDKKPTLLYSVDTAKPHIGPEIESSSINRARHRVGFEDRQIPVSEMLF